MLFPLSPRLHTVSNCSVAHNARNRREETSHQPLGGHTNPSLMHTRTIGIVTYTQAHLNSTTRKATGQKQPSLLTSSGLGNMADPACTRTLTCRCRDCSAFAGLSLKGIGDTAEQRMREEGEAPAAPPPKPATAKPSAARAAPPPPKPRITYDEDAPLAAAASAVRRTSVDASEAAVVAASSPAPRPASPPLPRAGATVALAYDPLAEEEGPGGEGAAAPPGPPLCALHFLALCVLLLCLCVLFVILLYADDRPLGDRLADKV